MDKGIIRNDFAILLLVVGFLAAAGQQFNAYHYAVIVVLVYYGYQKISQRISARLETF